MNTVKEIIGSIKVDAGNLYFIAESGKINGSLLISLEKAIKEYASIREQMAFEAGKRRQAFDDATHSYQRELTMDDNIPPDLEDYQKQNPVL